MRDQSIFILPTITQNLKLPIIERIKAKVKKYICL